MVNIFLVLFSVGFLAVMSPDAAACVNNILQFGTVRMNSGSWCVKMNLLCLRLVELPYWFKARFSLKILGIVCVFDNLLHARSKVSMKV